MEPKDLKNRPRSEVVYRRPKIQVFVDTWDWDRGALSQTYDITRSLSSYTFQKSILNPMTTGRIMILPQEEKLHYLDAFKPLDVVRIYEFGKLKFQGYIRKLGTSGSIDSDGKPHRNGELQITGFGGYFQETQLSIDASIEEGTWYEVAEQLANDLMKAENSESLQGMIETLLSAWFDYIRATVETNSGTYVHGAYFDRYFNYEDGVGSAALPGIPRDVFMAFMGEEDVNIWQIIQKLGEFPLYEFFVDEGPRTVHIDGEDVFLDLDRSYFIARPTPFDGTVSGGSELKLFRQMKAKTIPLQYLLKYNLNKSMEEVYSWYIAAPSIWSPSRYELIATGKTSIDVTAYSKYLFKRYDKPLYYIRTPKKNATEIDPNAPQVPQHANDAVQTFRNWYDKNDQFLSGTIEYMVPNEEREEQDPRIGDRLRIEGIDGSFYVQQVNHQWNYGGPLKGTAVVIRGWDRQKDQAIELKDRIFRKAKSAYWQRARSKR